MLPLPYSLLDGLAWSAAPDTVNARCRVSSVEGRHHGIARSWPSIRWHYHWMAEDQTPQMDTVDAELLSALQEDGRLSIALVGLALGV